MSITLTVPRATRGCQPPPVCRHFLATARRQATITLTESGPYPPYVFLVLGGGLDPVQNAVRIAERAVERSATTLLVPVSARRLLVGDLDEKAAKLSVLYYTHAADALPKALTA